MRSDLRTGNIAFESEINLQTFKKKTLGSEACNVKNGTLRLFLPFGRIAHCLFQPRHQLQQAPFDKQRQAAAEHKSSGDLETKAKRLAANEPDMTDR